MQSKSGMPAGWYGPPCTFITHHPWRLADRTIAATMSRSIGGSVAKEAE